MTFHHFAACGNALGCRVFGMIDLDELSHSIRISLDDAGDEEQQRPQESKERRHEADEERPAEIILEAAEHVAQLHRLVIPRLLEENKGHAVFQRPDHDQCADAGQDPRGCRFHQADQQAHGQAHHPEILKKKPILLLMLNSKSKKKKKVLSWNYKLKTR